MSDATSAAEFLDVLAAAMLDAANEGKCSQLQTTIISHRQASVPRWSGSSSCPRRWTGCALGTVRSSGGRREPRYLSLLQAETPTLRAVPLVWRGLGMPGSGLMREGISRVHSENRGATMSDKPSIAELQRFLRSERPGHWRSHDGAIRDAVPVLLEIAAAALAFREQNRIAAKARYEVYRQLHGKSVPSDSDYADTDAQHRKLKQCQDANDAALAKVRQ
jgi:hypothetical protein